MNIVSGLFNPFKIVQPNQQPYPFPVEDEKLKLAQRGRDAWTVLWSFMRERTGLHTRNITSPGVKRRVAQRNLLACRRVTGVQI